jgi:ubiquinone/menaquinone biosynthesis C-methylase UbiE
LPWDAAVSDVTVSGLVLNFVRDQESMVREMARVTRPGGSVAAYVWDYGGDLDNTAELRSRAGGALYCHDALG